MSGLSKSRLLAFLQCPKRLWLEVHRPQDRELPAATRLVFTHGHRVGEAARAQVPGGILVEPPAGLARALVETREHLGAADPRPLFEASFEHEGVLVRADVLLPRRGAWTMAEVKSSGSVKSYYIADVAIQRWVAEGAGLRLDAVELWHVDTGWIYPGGGDYSGLFVRRDLRAETAKLVREAGAWAADAKGTLAGGEPVIAMGPQCTSPFDCPYQEHCAAQAAPRPEFPVGLLPNQKGKKLAAKLAAEGYSDLRDVPPERFTDPALALIARVTREGRAFLDPEVSRQLAAQPYPRAYLDFESIGHAVPVWPGTRPYEQTPFQWSCHVEFPDGRLAHFDFLDLSGDDPSGACARALADAVPDEGPVFAYSAGFERRMLMRLVHAAPGQARKLRAIASRLVDLLPLVRAHYYHPRMLGSRSIKAVLPTIGAALDHAELDEIAEGSAAQLAYLEATDPATGSARRADLESKLRRYCELDTLGMVELARFLQRGTG